MPRVDDSIDINVPREKVFQYISDIELQPAWNKWAKKAESTSLVRSALGATDAMVMQVGPRKESVEGIVTEFKDGSLYSRRHTKGMEMTERYSLLTIGDMTKVAWSVEYVSPMGPIGKMNDMLFVTRLFEQLMHDSLNLLKGQLESAR